MFKNYRNYLPMAGLIITYICSRYDLFFEFNIYFLLINPVVFGFLSLLLNSIKYKGNKAYTESTFAILIQFILYLAALASSDDIGVQISTLYFTYVGVLEFLIMFIFYIVRKRKKR